MGKQYERTTLSLLLTTLNQIKRNRNKKIDVYVVNQTHIENEQDMAVHFGQKRDNAIDKKEAEEYRRTAKDIWTDVRILQNMLPESNRLSGNAHDAEEKERLDKIERENKVQSLF